MPRRPSDPNVQHLVVRLPVTIHEELKAKAVEEDLSVAQVVRRAVKRYLEPEGSPPVPAP